MSKIDSARLDELLDWLAEEVAARLSTAAGAVAAVPPSGPDQEVTTTLPAGGARQAEAPAPRSADAGLPVAEVSMSDPTVDAGEDQAPSIPAGGSPDDPSSLHAGEQILGSPSHAAQLLSRLAAGLLLVVVLINLPVFAHGVALARVIPGSASLVIRNGLLVKEADRPEVYVYQDGKFRWISDLEAFQYYGYQWKNVQMVEQGFLADYELGSPLSMVVKCQDSPHVYQLENGVKHWIMDIPSFTAAGYQWADVQIVDCDGLRDLPMGDTIPPGHGPAPQP